MQIIHSIINHRRNVVSTVHQRQTEKAEMLQTIKYQIKLQQMH